MIGEASWRSLDVTAGINYPVCGYAEPERRRCLGGQEVPHGSPDDRDTDGQAYANAGRLWAGGAATAFMAALAVVAGVLIARGVLGIALLAPKAGGSFGNSSTAVYAALAARAEKPRGRTRTGRTPSHSSDTRRMRPLLGSADVKIAKLPVAGAAALKPAS